MLRRRVGRPLGLLGFILAIIFIAYSIRSLPETQTQAIRIVNPPRIQIGEAAAKGQGQFQGQGEEVQEEEISEGISEGGELLLKIQEARELLETGTTKEELVARSKTLSKLMVAFNARGGVRNRDRFPQLAEDHIVLVVLSHRRADYLRMVLDALRLVEGISETLLIVSHDGYFPETVAAVRTVDFCQVAEVFTPYSPHVFPHTHPGTSPGDCPARISSEEARALGCVGDPDQYGNYREGKFVSLKHHWFWLMNYLWDGFPHLQGFNGYLAFIEEDHVLSRNAYVNLKAVAALRQDHCRENCAFLNIGPSIGDGVTTPHHSHHPGVTIGTVHNAGYAFDRAVWNRIRASASLFCEFGDYNWDFSLSFLLDKWHPNVASIMPKTESMIHIGKCGMHIKSADCNPSKDIATFFAEEHPFVDTHSPQVDRTEPTRFRHGFTGWGGWGDRRDKALCMRFTSMNDDPME